MSKLRLIANIVDKKPRTVESYFYRRGWKVTNPENVRQYLLKYIKDERYI